MIVEAQELLKRVTAEYKSVELPNRDLVRLGMRARRLIRKRTKKGIDYRGEKFEPYSERYAEEREEAGRTTERVTLSFTGRMLATLTAVASDKKALLRFSNSDNARIANYHNDYEEPRGVMPLRRFLDIVEDTPEYETLASMAAKMYARQVGN